MPDLWHVDLLTLRLPFCTSVALSESNNKRSLLALHVHASNQKTASVSAFMTKPGYGFSLRPRHLLKLELLKTKQM